MEDTPSEFFNEVQQKLAEMGLSADLTQDERDIVDDYEMQQFSAEACIEHLAKQRTETKTTN